MHFLSRILFNPIVIWLVTCLVLQSIGSVVVPGLIGPYLLGEDGIMEILTREVGFCGSYGGLEDWRVVLCRLFYPKEVVIILFIPLLISAVTPWLVMMLRARKFFFFASRSQRWVIVSSMGLILLVFLLITASQTPQYILFTGPIHGFHPLLPLVIRGSNVFTLFSFWALIDGISRKKEDSDG